MFSGVELGSSCLKQINLYQEVKLRFVEEYGEIN